MEDPIVIIHDERQLDWKRSELDKIIGMWEAGQSLSEITVYFQKRVNPFTVQMDIFLALSHLSFEGEIKVRPGALMGSAS